MSANRYDDEIIRQLSEKSGLPREHIRELVDELRSDDNAIRNRIQVEMFERDAQLSDWKSLQTG